MSWAILGFQLTILVTTVLAARYGQGRRRLVFWGWLLFTLFGSIFTFGLLLLQLVTVFGSNWLAEKLSKPSVSSKSKNLIDGVRAEPTTIRTLQEARPVEVTLPSPVQMPSEKKEHGIWLWAVGIICAGLIWLWINSSEPAPKASAISQSHPPTPLPVEADTDTDASPEKVSSKNRERPDKSSDAKTQARRTQQTAKPVQGSGQQKGRVDVRESTPVTRYEADRLKHACAPDEVRKYNWRTNKNECTAASSSSQ